MTAMTAIAGVTLRGLLGRRRTALMLLLVALPVLMGIVIRISGGRSDAAEILDILVIRTVLPLVALILGTAAIGSEVEDGTAVYLLIKPVPRWQIAVAKLAVAAGLTVALVVPPTIITGILVSGTGSVAVTTTMGFAVAVLIGGTAYACAFTTLGALTTRALIIGLAYTLIWEGVLAGLLESTKFLSIRQATLGIAAALTGEDPSAVPLDLPVAVGIVVVVIAGSLAWTTAALARFQIRSAD
jgi:ABC-2 type transport system permease protein